jgi:cytidine deaminase
MAGESAVTAIAVTAAPCGHCRQFLIEASPAGEMEVLVEGAAPTNLAALLPAFFGPRDLGRHEGMFPVRERDLTLAEPSNDPLVLAALDAARRSYAPYTKSYSGVALGTVDGRIFAGSYIENAAFNPSLPPLQCALAGLFAGGVDPTAIGRAVLVEMEEAKVSQRASLVALGCLVPHLQLECAAAFSRRFR